MHILNNMNSMQMKSVFCDQDPLAFVANQQMTPSHFKAYQSLYNNPQLQQQFSPSQYGSIHPNQHYSSTYPSQPQFNQSSVPPSYPYQSQMIIKPHLFAEPIFSLRDDPIAYLNKEMAFLTAVASSRVIVQQVQRRQGESYSGTGYKSNATSSGGNNASGQEKDPGVSDGQVVQTIIPNNAAFQTKDLDTYDSDCDDILNAKAVLTTNICNYGFDVFSEDLKAQIQDKVFVITSLKNNLRKLKGKEIVDIAAQTPYANTIVPGMFKLDLDPLAPKLLQNREAHIDYLKYTQEQADILQGIVEQAKAKQPLDNALDFACKHA
nr:hypothetical protein [Tanacetum cinerariifolium]